MNTKISAILVGIVLIAMLVILVADPFADAQSDSDDYGSGGWSQMDDDKNMRGTGMDRMSVDDEDEMEPMTQDEMDDMMKRQHDTRMEDGEMNAGMDHEKMMGMMGMNDPLDELKIAICVLEPTKGNKVNGIVNFWEDGNDVVVMAEIKGLEPNSEHGFHIHEYGDISESDGKGTGDHYNPEGHKHGMPEMKDRHAGDFGNIMSDDKGEAMLMLRVDNITIGKNKNPIIGRGMIVHAMNDKGTQPVGDAGARIAQGVIGVGNPKDMGSMPKFEGMGMMNGKPIEVKDEGGVEVEQMMQ
ncbi:Superoxide dismutase [Cu-Zn] precursor [Poriferisphaera corsica]|uniref:Superoxide dismutase [Cu-Zn] n=1 Tax=Poriferisphaera corsica TaxID=2528020 RepID=A0A517YQ36_9BACT|nr:superoxide dismutase family protein [Poriferisphaera corsica]QDU32332.1 Superoxide dismutase [Cu-Zn] precursor [Poriferisphaera corsica]